MPRKLKVRVHISDWGSWYARAGNNNHATRIALVYAIDYCKRMNARRAKGGA